MTARVSRRAVDLLDVVELPTVEAPQYVDENGYEVAAETFAQALEQAARPEHTNAGTAEISSAPINVADEEEPMETEVEEVNEDEDEAIVADEEQELQEPLLSLSDSNVLHYSLVATRQHHLKHLLPHMFSHPTIPANSRPRARPPPKGTFLWPTPPPLVHPLPNREYHAPTQTPSTNLGTSTPPGGDGTPDQVKETTADIPGAIKRKYGRGKGKGKDKMDGAPAHEIECLARVTLSIGPISYPDTELWVGRFVQPRAALPKSQKVQRDKTERKRSTADVSALGPKRPKLKPGPVPKSHGPRPTSGYPPYPGIAGPSNYRPPFRPPGGVSGSPYPGQVAPPGPPRPPPPRAELSPDLIRRVNEAATQHPWLSQIIHKAARTQATKEELAKLGRVVNRLKEGKDVGEGPDDPPPPTLQYRPVPSAASSAGHPPRPPIPASARPIPPAPSTAQTSGVGSSSPQPETLSVPQPGTTMSRTLSTSSGPLTPPPEEGDSDDDSDVDMTGPRQVGGGPGGIDPALTEEQSPESTVAGEAGSAPLPHVTPHPVQYPAVHPSVIGNNPPPPVPATVHGPPDSSSFSASPQYRPVYPAMAPPNSQIRPPQTYPPQYSPGSPAYTSQSPAPQPPPPPRPTYPLPPPFLLVAFRDAPTEKFLLPLGSLSYVSRHGGEPEPQAPVQKPPTPPAMDPAPAPVLEPSIAAAETAVPIKSRTRASLGRNAKIPTPEPAVPSPVPEPKVETPAMPAKLELPRSGLSPLPGTEPVNGTVLVSTFVPAGEWQRPDWKALSKSLPFNNPLFEPKPRPDPEVKIESPSIAPASGDVSASPRSANRRRKSATEDAGSKAEDQSDPLPVRCKLLNLAAESFIPEDSEVHAVTIRLGDVDDGVWQRIKTVTGMISTAEMRSLGEHEPNLMVTSESPAIAPGVKAESVPVSGVTGVPTATTHVLAPNPARPGFHPSPELKNSYLARKRNLFKQLLLRVPTRKFLRFRLSSPRSDIVDATADRWAPRPYPISTKALYTREEEDNADELLLLSPELQPKKGNKKQPEPTVTFEMPVSLDQLDERVAESAMSGKKLKGEDGRKRHGKRWIPGTICEGCGQAGKRVWRAGPGGKGTLCNACGDKWTSGILGPLAAPSAAKEDDEQNDVEQSADKISDGAEQKTAEQQESTEPSTEENCIVVEPKSSTIVREGVSHPSTTVDEVPQQPEQRNQQHKTNDTVHISSPRNADTGQAEGGDRMDVDLSHSLQIDREQSGVSVPHLSGVGDPIVGEQQSTHPTLSRSTDAVEAPNHSVSTQAESEGPK